MEQACEPSSFTLSSPSLLQVQGKDLQLSGPPSKAIGKESVIESIRALVLKVWSLG